MRLGERGCVLGRLSVFQCACLHVDGSGWVSVLINRYVYVEVCLGAFE